MKNRLSVLLIGLKLLLIAAVVAGIVSFVNAKTAPVATENINREKTKAIAQIFGNNQQIETTERDGIYTVTLDGETIGYCLESTSSGFGGDLTLMVGYDADATLRGVQVISHSETPGLGARVCDGEEGALSQYAGKSGILTLGKEVDAVSGATISSRAVLKGVNQATEKLLAFLGGEQA